MNGDEDISKQVKVTIPQSGLPSGRLIDVYGIRLDGTIVGMNASNPTESTLYYIPIGHYEFINETENETCECKLHNEEPFDLAEYPNDNVVRYDAYDGCYMVGNEDAISLIMKYEGKAIRIVEI